MPTCVPTYIESYIQYDTRRYRLRHDGWMMDDLGVIIQAGWMIWAATWMMALDDEKQKTLISDDFPPTWRGPFLSS